MPLPMILLALALPLAAPDKAATPDPGSAAVARATALLTAGKSAEAIAPLDEAIAYYERTHAGEKQAIYCGGSGAEVLLYMGMAAKDKRGAVALGPDWCDALFLKGYALVDQGRVADGIPYLDRALAMAPFNAHYLNELGYAYQRLKDWPKSLAAYERARGAAGLAEGKDAKVIEECRALRGLGFAYIETGKWDDAEKAFRDCLKIDPRDEKAKGELDYIRDNRGKS